MEQNTQKSKPYFFKLDKVNTSFAAGKEAIILNYARTLFYAARHDKCTYRGEIEGVSVECDGKKTPIQILSEVEAEHKNRRQAYIELPYGKWLMDFETTLKTFADTDLKKAIDSSKKAGTLLPLTDWYKEAMQTQTVINDFLKKHQDALTYAPYLFDLTLNVQTIAQVMKEAGFPGEKEIYEELLNRGTMPERETAEKFIAAGFLELSPVTKERLEGRIKAYRASLFQETTAMPAKTLSGKNTFSNVELNAGSDMNSDRALTSPVAPSAWLQSLTPRPTAPKLAVASKTRSIEERLFPRRGNTAQRN